MIVRDLIVELLKMPMDAAVNVVYEYEDDYTYRKNLMIVDYEDGDVGILALSECPKEP